MRSEEEVVSSSDIVSEEVWKENGRVGGSIMKIINKNSAETPNEDASIKIQSDNGAFRDGYFKKGDRVGKNTRRRRGVSVSETENTVKIATPNEETSVMRKKKRRERRSL